MELGPTVAHLWRRRVATTPSALAFRYREAGVWRPSTWREADERVRRIAGGLLSLGIGRGDRVAIASRTRVEWILADFAALCAGAAVTTIYPSVTPDEAAFVLEDSGAAVVFVEDQEQLDKLDAERARTRGVRARVVFEAAPGVEDGRTLTLASLEARGAAWLDAHPGAVDAAIDALGPDDLATLIYTSGTTGRPKGVMLSHDNWVYQAEAITGTLGGHLQEGDAQYLFLPLAHSFGKVCELIAVALGVPTAVEGDVEALLDGLRATRPTLMAAVPRVFEKIFNRVVQRAQEAGPRRYAVFRWAVGVGDEVARRRLAGQRVGRRLSARFALADRLVFRKVRAALGGRLRGFVSGGAPLSEEIGRFFWAAGLVVIEGYGLTETSAGATANDLEDVRFGTVGRPLPGSEVRIAADGEVLLRGRNVMRGYWNRPEATAEALGPDGWLRTGDLGAIDPDGRLRITGRKKELIVTSGGKNVAPANVENRIKGRSPWVAEVMLHGDRRPYCVALIWLDPEAVGAWAEREGLADRSLAALAADGRVRDRIWEGVEQVNREVASYEGVKRIVLVPEPLEPTGGLLTPSLKLKRAAVEERYRALLDACYEGTLARV